MYIYILSLTNAIEALKSEFLADPGIIRPEFAGSFLLKIQNFVYLLQA